jgi:hypothetical protein
MYLPRQVSRAPPTRNRPRDGMLLRRQQRRQLRRQQWRQQQSDSSNSSSKSSSNSSNTIINNNIKHDYTSDGLCALNGVRAGDVDAAADQL